MYTVITSGIVYRTSFPWILIFFVFILLYSCAHSPISDIFTPFSLVSFKTKVPFRSGVPGRVRLLQTTSSSLNLLSPTNTHLLLRLSRRTSVPKSPPSIFILSCAR
ncbi:hypothetical protein BYT27DRAFT_6346866 [Phlegmacium glaucopus]|nr:hypothetical protein BYT27DRAFT_6346866 [Phlegmacium glaucopus]